jgi:hypothetical protein
MVCIDVLTEQRDLAHAMGHKPAGLHRNLRHRPRKLRATGVRDHAERAELVASFLYGEERRRLARLHALRQVGELVFVAKLGVDDRLTLGRRFDDELGQAVVRLRSDDDINDRGAMHDLRPLGLGYAARNRDHRILALGLPVPLDLTDAP